MNNNKKRLIKFQTDLVSKSLILDPFILESDHTQTKQLLLLALLYLREDMFVEDGN